MQRQKGKTQDGVKDRLSVPRWSVLMIKRKSRRRRRRWSILALKIQSE
jgi:hypothetical protein